MGGGDGAEVTRTVVGADTTIKGVAYPLWMVPNVEKFRAELKIGAAFFAENEILEKRDVPVIPARAAHRVSGFVAPGSRCGY